MIRLWSIVLGIGLVLLWIAELGSPGLREFAPGAGGASAVSWITWLDLVGAFFAFAIGAGAYSRYLDRSTRVGGPIALAVGLFALWLVGLTSHVASWVSWWNFVFACAFLLTGIAGAAEESSGYRRSYERQGHGNGYRGYGYWPYESYGMFPFYGYGEYGFGRWEGSDRGLRERQARGTRGYQRSEARICEDVNDRLSDSWDLDASDIEVKVTQGEVTLCGTVANRRERRTAEAIAESVSGVREVHNELSVRAEQPKDKLGRPRAA